MGCAAGTFQDRCRNPACSYTPDAEADHGYCCHLVASDIIGPKQQQIKKEDQ